MVVEMKSIFQSLPDDKETHLWLPSFLLPTADIANSSQAFPKPVSCLRILSTASQAIQINQSRVDF